jgi:hypothetical protein
MCSGLTEKSAYRQRFRNGFWGKIKDFPFRSRFFTGTLPFHSFATAAHASVSGGIASIPTHSLNEQARHD